MGLLNRALGAYGAATAPQVTAPGQTPAPPDKSYDILLKILSGAGGGAVGSTAGLIEQILRKRRQQPPTGPRPTLQSPPISDHPIFGSSPSPDDEYGL